MAQFSADLNPKSNAMSLGDIMKAGMYGAEMDVLNRQAAIAREKEKEIPTIQTYAKDPNNKLPDGSFDLKQLPALMSMAPLTGPDFAKNIIDLTKNHIETNRAMNELAKDNRQQFSSIYGNYGQMAARGREVSGPEIIASFNRLKEYNPQLATVADLHIKGLKAFGNKPIPAEELMKYSNESLTSKELIDQFSPKVTTGQIGKATVGIVTQPSVMGEQPTISTTQLGGGTPMQTTGETSTSGKALPKLIQEDTSMNYTGPANPLNLDQIREDLYLAGKKNVEKSNEAITSVKNIQQSVRKVEDYINSAAGSKVGQMVRQGQKFVFSDPELDATVKNLANIQARNASLMGLDKTDSSRELNSKLSGSENIAPEALAGVMQQVKAEAKAAEQYVAGINKFVEKRGDVNGYIQQQKFQNKWAENYDPRIFQLNNIEESNYPETVKDQRVNEITKNMSDKERQELVKKTQVIDRLTKGLYR